MLILRDYQQDIISKTYQSMAVGSKRPLVVLPTGGGKTVCFAWMANAAQQKGTTIWFLVHRNELLDQTKATFEKFGIPTDRVHIGMVGQVARNVKLFPKPDLIIFDEGHHSVSATWTKIIDQFPDAWIIGLTATPCRLDGKPLGDVYDDLVESVTTADLIDSGYLAPYRCFSIASKDLKGLKRKGKDYDMEDAADVMMDRAVYGDVIKHYQELADGKRAICFCTTVRHSEAMADEFCQAGIRAVHFDGNTPKRQRKEIVERFRSGEIQILCNVALVSEGFDLAACDAVILLRPTQSLSLYLQQVGRALRPADGKTAIILDHVGNAIRHGLPDDSREWSLTSPIVTSSPYKENGQLALRTCFWCYAVFPASVKACPVCGEVYVSTQEELEQIKQVELVELKKRQEQKKQTWNETRSSHLNVEADCKSYNDLLLLGKKVGMSDPKRWAISRAYTKGFKLPWTKKQH